jgi:hypothetical protein
MQRADRHWHAGHTENVFLRITTDGILRSHVRDRSLNLVLVEEALEGLRDPLDGIAIVGRGA